MTDPIREAIAANDHCEIGRLMVTQHAALLASIAGPESPYGAVSESSGHRMCGTRHGPAPSSEEKK